MRSRVVLLSSVKLIREGLELRITRADATFDLVGAFDHLDVAIEAIRTSGANVAIVDHREGADAARRLRAETGAAIVVLGLRSEADQEILSWAESGVTGYLASKAGIEELIEAIDLAARGEATCTPRNARVLARRIEYNSYPANCQTVRAIASLTARETEVLTFLQEGLSNKEIGRVLSIQTATVKNHVHNILEKLGVSRRGEAVALTVRTGGKGAWKPD